MSPEEKIKRSIASGQISHAYIFEGSRVSNKEAVARSFLKTLSGTPNLDACPDLYVVRAEAEKGRTVKSIKDQDLEELQANLKMKPQGERNLALIYDADSMTVRAQNRFLKTLEEPTPGTVIVLLSENTENLLETIRSRCVIFRFYDNAVNDEDVSDLEEMADEVISARTFHDAKKIISQGVRTREDAYSFLDVLELRYRDIMVGKRQFPGSVSKDEAIRNIEEIEKTRRALDGNAIVGYAIRHLVLKIQES